MDWLMMPMVIGQMYLIGIKSRWGWWLNLVNNFLYLFVIFHDKRYGFLVLNIVMSVIAVKALIQWSTDGTERIGQEGEGHIQTQRA